MTVLVRAPRELDLAWAQRVLGERARAASLETKLVDVGTTTRVLLRIEHDGPPELPRDWFVKLPSRSWRAWAVTALPRLPQTEVRFYEELAAEVPVALPRALAARTRVGRGFVLVLEDLRESGCVPGRPGDALDAEQAGRVTDLLARLHASRWEDPRLDGPLAWLAGPVRRLEDGLGTALAVPLMRRGLDRAGDAVPAALRTPALRYARLRRRAMRNLTSGPRTLIHHDCHPGNLYWRGEEPGLLDWQLVRIGEGVGDLAYLCATALRPEVRRAAEPALLARYAAALAAAGVTPPADLADRYRAHLSYAFEAMVVTLAVGGLMQEEVVLELVRRTASAVADHDAFAAAGV
ncbi:MAG: phosphotransferase family protein [Planctomycetota bacterium]